VWEGDGKGDDATVARVGEEEGKAVGCRDGAADVWCGGSGGGSMGIGVSFSGALGRHALWAIRVLREVAMGRDGAE
jgi:hypothetical protein